MTKAKYMALDDLQTVWDDKMKPYIEQGLGGKAAATHTHTKSDITDYDNPEAAFVGETLVFYSGAAFSGEVLVLG